jgi:hypothetical protein
MDYVALLKFRSSLSSVERDAALVRLVERQPPEEVRVIAEYWPAASAVQVVSIFSTDTPGKVVQLLLEWGDVFEIDVYPAVSGEEWHRLRAETVPRLTRLQQSS